MSALDLVALVFFRFLRVRSVLRDFWSVLMRLGGSLWLTYLQCHKSRRADRLIALVSLDAWNLGWDRLWSGAVLYWVTKARVPRSRLGP
jgi:hypothetical protein